MTQAAVRRRRRPPLDPRLLKYSPSARRYVIVVALASSASVVAVIVGAVALAGLLSELITDPAARSFGAQAGHLGVLASALAARAVLSYAVDRYAHRAALSTITELRVRALDALTDPARTSPRTLAAERDGAQTVVLRGLDGLTGYLSGYLPALLASAIVTPLVIVVIAWADWSSALIILVTLPLIPIFMVLIGLMTQDKTQRRLDSMSRLTAQLLDLLAGLPTLRALGRAQGSAGRVGMLGQDLRTRTMSALRVAFLSGAVLEFFATLCVALVAVSIGLRLVFGDISLYAGVLALVLAPEVYLPLRQVGAQFHASQDGLTASGRVFEVIEGAPAAAPAGELRRVEVAGRPITFEGFGIRGRDGWAPAALDGTCRPGTLTVLTGPNGAGKSTALEAIAALIAPGAGTVRIGDVPVGDLDPVHLRSRLAWLPQQPVIVPGTVRENLALFGEPESVALIAALAATGFDDVLAGLDDRMDTVLGAGGTGLSAGQRQRLALTRTLASDAPVLLLDEPVAHLDDASRDRVLAALTQRARAGATVIVVAHRAAELAVADTVLQVRGTGASDE